MLALGPLNRSLNEAGTEELVEAANEIALPHLARIAVKETIRYEEWCNRHVDRQERTQHGTARTSPVINDVRADRDHAINAFLAVRERQAKIRHLEMINNRPHVEKEGAAGMSGGRRKKARRRVNSKGNGMDVIGLIKALGLGFCHGACIEKRPASARIRWREWDSHTNRIKRYSLRLSNDLETIARAEAALERARQDRALCKHMEQWVGMMEREEKKKAEAELAVLRGRLLAACPRGEVVRRRVGAAFDHVAEMGLAALTDFIDRRPWEATGRPAGRPRDRNCLK